MNNNTKELVIFFDEIFKKLSWYTYSNEEWYTLIEIKDGIIFDLKKSESDLMTFLKNKSLELIKNQNAPLTKVDRLKLKKLIDNDFKDVANLTDNKKINSELYKTYTKKENKKYQDKNFIEIYESTRKERLMDDLDSTVGILNKINNKQIDFDDKEVWDSLRNGVDKYSEQNEMNPYEYINYILNEFLTGSKLAKNLILSLCKDASRQNLSEEIQKKVWFENGINLIGQPQSGDNSIHIYDGKWVKGIDLIKDNKGIASKAMDFKLLTLKNDFYTYNKYNKWIGGATDDTFNDVKKTIELFIKISYNTTKLMFILDGKYWDDGKRNELKSQYINNDMLLITCTDECKNEEVINFIGIEKN